MTQLITEHRPAGFILLAFVCLAIGYNLATPPLEAGDESRHYAVVKYIAETGRLPVQNIPQTQAYQTHWSHEGNQPPLYYALAAALTFWIDTGSWAETFRYNPHTTIGNPLRPDNKNITIHPPAESWPWRGHVLAVHLIRFLSISLASVTVAAAYFIALSLFRGNRWLACGAMAITAFNPMFIFISAAINNDNAVIMFITLALCQLIIINEQLSNRTTVISQPIDKPILKSVIVLGLLIALGTLSKLYAFGLFPLAALLFLRLTYQTHPLNNTTSSTDSAPHPTPHVPRTTHYALRITHYALRITLYTLSYTTLLLLIFLLIAGWFYLRNALLYDGDFLALQVMRETAGQRRELPSLATLLAEFQGFRIAYWALFGGVNILVANWIYTLLDWLSLIALIGVITFTIYDLPTGGLWLRFTIYDLRFTICDLRFAICDLRFAITRAMSRITGYAPERILPVKRSTPPHPLRFTNYVSRFTLHVSRFTFLLLLTWTLIMLAGFIVWNLTQPAGQGRLLYPAIAAISALGMLGLTWWLPPLAQKVAAALVAGGLFLFAVLVPMIYIVPVYAKPPILTEASLPAGLQPANFIYDGAMRLVGFQPHAATVRPAETLGLTLYWQLLRPVEQDYSIFIHLLGRQRQVISQIDTYPGGGRWPTSLLKPGDILADHYEIPIPSETENGQAPTRLQIAAGIYDFFEPGRPGRPATTTAGEPVDPLISSLKLIPWQWPTPARMDQPINFFDKASLLSYHLANDGQSLTLHWRADGSFETDYTVFIQAWRLAGSFPPGGENLLPASTGPAKYAAGFDGPPVGGDYPTSLWSPGEIIVDTHPLDLSQLSPGRYKLLIGLYNPMTDERLPAFDLNGPIPDYAVNLGTLNIPK